MMSPQYGGGHGDDDRYLNALTFFSTLFKTSPIGAAFPEGQEVDGMTLPTISDPQDVAALQQIAHDTVMPNMDTWWTKDGMKEATARPSRA